MRYLILLGYLVAGHLAFSQNHELDSLYKALEKHSLEDTTRVRLLLQICWQEYTSHPEKSKSFAEVALRLSRNLNFPDGEGDAIRYVGLYYWSVGDYEQATDHAYKALRIFEKIQDIKGLGLCYQLLGLINKEQSDVEKANVFYNRALEMFQKANDKKRMGYAYNSIGVLFLTFSKFDQALENFQKSIEIRKEINDKEGLSQSYVNLAIVYTNQKKYKEALVYFEKNITLLEGLDNKYRMAVNFDGMGHLYTLTGDYDKAEACLLKAVALAKIIGYKKTLEVAYSKLTFLEEKRGRYKNALQYNQLEAVYRDSIYTEEKAKQIAEIETRYETEKKDQQIKLLERDRRIQLLWRNIFVAALLFVTMLLVLIYFLQRYRERKNRDILNLKIDYLTNQHKELAERYKDTLTIKDEKSIVSRDQLLLKKAIELVENNVSDPLFSVEKMAEEMGMSRTNMHRKIKAITGFPPSELIRNIRLRKAALLLRNQTDSVSQISFAVGFEEHSYFSKAFKKQYGVTPSEYSQSTKAIEVLQ